MRGREGRGREGRVHLPQVRALCPAVLHLMQTRALSGVLATEGGAVVAVDVVADCKHTAGFGHTTSRTSSGQY